jgi:hypothetical protein
MRAMVLGIRGGPTPLARLCGTDSTTVAKNNPADFAGLLDIVNNGAGAVFSSLA